MRNFLLALSIILSSLSLALNIILLNELDIFHSQIDRIIIPVTEDDLEKLMEEIKNLSDYNEYMTQET